MSDEINANDQGFLRQRRNLIIGSLLVLFLDTTVSPPDNLSILGVTTKITHADYVVYWLWVFTGYWLLRFFQYLPRREQLWNVFDVAYMESMQLLAARIVNREFIKKYPQEKHNIVNYFIGWKDINFPVPIKPFQVKFENRGISYRNSETGAMGSHSVNRQESISITFSGVRSLVLNLFALINMCIRTPLFTEYVVPVLLFVSAAVSSAHRIL